MIVEDAPDLPGTESIDVASDKQGCVNTSKERRLPRRTLRHPDYPEGGIGRPDQTRGIGRLRFLVEEKVKPSAMRAGHGVLLGIPFPNTQAINKRA